MTTHMRRILASIAIVALFWAVLPSIALASLDDWPDPVGASSTNPNPGPGSVDYAQYWWRQGWGNSVEPELMWNLPKNFDPKSEGQILGQLYTVDRDLFTVIDSTNTPDAYLRSTYGNLSGGPYGTNMSTTYDMLGILANDPLGAILTTGATVPVEGQWFIHAKYYTTNRYSYRTLTVPLGIDVTPPRPVTGLQVSTGVGQPAVSGVVPTKQAHITWNPEVHDDLSGDAYYQILLDDRSLDATEQGRVYSAPWLPTPSTFTIEDMPSGRHKISVVVVDRATNQSTAESVYFSSDPDTPTVKFTSPLNGTFGVHTIISADASDAGGSPTVIFGIDGTSVATLTAPPYSFRPDLSSIMVGTHVLSATAVDSYGRAVTVTETVSTTSLPSSVGYMPSDWESLNAAMGGGLADDPSGSGWTNSLRPQLKIPVATPDIRYPDEGVVNGILYVVDKSADTTIDIAAPDKYFHEMWLDPTAPLRPTIDLLSVLNFPPVAGWPALLPGESSVVEGQWYLHYVPVTSGGFASPITQSAPFRVDVTNPTAVTGLVVSPSINASDAGLWTSGSRAHVSWTNGVYDDLAGLKYYEITLDGTPVSGAQIQGGLTTFTMEDMPAGVHTVGVRVVDNAGNVSSVESREFLSDPDTPTISITAPQPGGYVRETSYIAVNPADASGPPTVTVAIDGTPLATLTGTPYAFKPDLTGIPAGTHVLSATAVDHLGRSVTATEAVVTFASTPPGGLYPSANPALDTSIAVISATNPSDTWRDGWGNSLHPKFNVQMPGTIPAEGPLLGLLYSLDRSADTTVDIGHPLNYFRSGTTSGPSLDWSVDLGSVLAYPPVGGWPALEPGAVVQAEGSWYLHFSPYTQAGYAGAVTQTSRVKIDVTPPRKITGLTVSPSLNPADGGTWVTGSRAHLAWNPGIYDDLSGVAYYKVYVDGVALATAPGQDGAIWELTNGQHQSAYTLENMAPGHHVISIAAVDRATNEGPLASADYYCDPDVPTIRITQPTSGFLGVNSRVVAEATDLAGIVNVKFAIDGSNLATLTAAPYSTVLDVSSFSLGAHVLSATATDFYGHSAVATQAIIITSNALSSGGLIPSASDGFGAADGWSYTSDTNPSADDDALLWFRHSWGNTLHPKFTYAAPGSDPAVDGYVIGMLYTVDKDPNTVIDITQPERYLRTTDVNGTLLDGTVDILGTSLFPPVGGWPALGAGESSVLEGHWYVHVAPFTNLGFAPRVTSTIPLNVDITAPRAVQNFSASPSLDPADAGSWTSATRAHLTWSPLTYDDLAGVAYYKVYLDGKPALKSNGDPVQVFDIVGHTPTSVTLENMPAGDHVVGISAVDRALNEGPITTTHFYSDIDTPTVSFTAPAGDWINRNTLVSVQAADDAGDPTVVFQVDGVTTATVSAAPYSFTPRIDGLAGGTHVITATVTDHLGRTATATKTVKSVAVTADGYQPDVTGALDPEPGAAQAVGTADPSGVIWVKTLTPEWSVTGSSSAKGMLYTADKSPSTQVDMSRPSDYFFSPTSAHTLLSGTIDISSLLAHPPVGGWPAPGAGETSVAEGKWYVHYLPVDDARHAGTRSGVATIAIDMTPPTAASNLHASPTTNPADAGGWNGTRRANVTWSVTAADALSGIRYYQVYLDGAPLVSADGGPSDGRITDFAGRSQVGLTIEDLTAGTHIIQVAAVDWAGNEGPKISAQYRCDLVGPTVSLTSPVGSTLNRFTAISADAADDAGDPTVVFAMDGVPLATITSAPYSFMPDMSALTGGAHVLSATATDHLGRTMTASKAINIVLPSDGLEPGPSGALDATLTAVCDTNPNTPLDPNGWWRNGWGNTLRPTFTIQVPTVDPAVEGWVNGLLYTVDKSPSTVVDINTPELYARSSRGNGTDMDSTVDMLGVIADPPFGGWPAPGVGENSVAEGVWYFHYTPFTTMGFASSFTRTVQYKIDLTAPRAVAGLVATPSTTPSVWAPSGRVKLSWTPGAYDDLSGVAYYRIFIDGTPLDANSALGRIYDMGGKLPSTYTIENAPAGAHTFSIAAVDRAGNQGPKSSVVFRSDPDVPSVSFTSPLNGFLNSQSIVAVNATDLAGDPVVRFGIDGVTTATVSAPPYSFKPDVSGLVPGVHVLSATATDHYGRSAIATLAVTSVSSTSSAVGGFEPSDSGVLDGDIAVSSVTNPIPPKDNDSSWRLTWGNTLHPQFAIEPPNTDPDIDGEILGMLYTVDKSASTAIDISHPDRYFRASRGTGTNLDASLDLAGTLLYPPVGGWPALGTGETSSAEGQWYLHFTLFTTKGYAGGVTHNVAFKVDVTNPRAVTNLTCSPTTNPADGGSWTAATRAHVAWTPNFYDSLAGVAYYRVYIDGVATDSDDAQGKVWEIADKTPSSLTVENMPAGLHHIAVAAVDRAGNEGPRVTTDFMTDPAAPTVSITSPGNAIIDSRTTISVNASDSAGDPTVVLRLDGTLLKTLSSAPYDFKPDITSLPTGGHVLSATATDHLGRSVIATLAVTVIGPQPGFESDPSGALDTPVNATSETNPIGSGADIWWRQGWGNSLYPQISIAAPSVDPNVSGLVVGTLYAVDKSAGTTIDIHRPELYSRSSRLNGPNIENTIDLLGVQAVPPVGGWPALGPGETSVSEGTWYYHTVFFTSLGYAGTSTQTFPLRVDLTKPRAVTGLTVTPTTTNASWGSTSRATLSWTPGTYDDLSGVAYYRIYLDGQPLDTDASQGRVYEVEGKTPSSFTLENMPAGHHTLSVSCVDRATNEGPVRTVDFYSDPDVPTITLLSPLNHKISARTAISVDASDLAGNPRVVFQIDGVTTGTVLAPPYSITPKITGLSSGVHTITVTAYDKLNRMASVTTTVTKSSVGAGFLPSESEDLNGPMTGTSSTNPNDPESASVWWRNGWGKTMQPQFTIDAPTEVQDEGFVIGMLYNIDRSPTTLIDITRPDLYSRASRATGTNLNTTIDLQGVLDFPPAGGWPAPGPGEVLPGEGVWYMHFAPFTSEGYAAATTHYITIGVDLTKPRAVTGLVVSPSMSAADANRWVDTSRAIVTWNQGVYDDLSGVAYYQVYLDGQPVDDTVQGHVFEVAGKTPNSYTIENMPAGMHKVSVAAVDRAGNVGTLSNGYFYSDPDVPTISFGSFSSTVGIKPRFTVKVADQGGVRSVRYTLDGQLLGTMTDSPWDISPDLSGFSSGSHVLTAMVSDQFGHTAQVSMTIYLDKTPMTVSGFSRTPSIFYPIIKDGYYDYSTIKYTTNKSSTVTLTIRNSAGSTVRTIKASVSSGAHSMKWDGKWSKDGKAHTGDFTYQITAVDGIGQKYTTGKLKTTIRDYQIVTSGNVAKVIPR